ncbi:class I adenylate-forming enzyme family protein [Oceanicaulis alexandrii]|uniref:class I adenylate-forming enzyme family protein n=1 Tax=Oceanicaulis alexandrii TaxID=153233 RepID=UPI002355612C|nr:AMP-binding protein [Oceanicaulis alexandrii]
MSLDLNSAPAADAIDRLGRDPTRIAAVCYDAEARKISEIAAGDLLNAARSAAAIIDQRTPKGGRVAIAAGNSINHLCVWLGVQIAGRIWVPLGLSNGPEPTAHALSLARPDLVCADPAGARLLGAAGAANALALDALGADTARFDALYASGAQTMAIKFTGGSTGRPKAVVQSCRSVMANRINMADRFPLASDDVVLASAPLTHGSSHFILPALAAGARLVLVDRASPAALARIMAKEGVTTGFTAPTAIQRLAAALAESGTQLHALRRLIYGAAPFPVPALIRAQETLGPRIAGLYGQTEAPMTITTISETELANPELQTSVGRPAPLSQVTILGPGGETLAPGETGEITLAGPLIMDGYLGDPEKTADTIKDGRLHTGDLGRMDEQGRLFITGRASELIISGGFNVFPSEVEAALLATGAVGEACVFGAQDLDWGERVEAAVTAPTAGRVDVDALRAAVRERLGPVKTPKRIHVLDALPRNGLGKLMRTDLVRQFSETS